MVAQSARVSRVLAPNPSPMTLEGTNSYLIAVAPGRMVAVDPGPADEDHIDAIAAAARQAHATIEAILVTHGHPDHAPGARLLAEITAAPVHAHRNARFPHDRVLDDGDVLHYAETSIRAIDAPGHTFDHLVFRLDDERALFTGDVILGRGTVVIAPPGGAMRPYQATLARLRDEHADAERIYPGHGPLIDDPRAKIEEYIAHRATREREIVAALGTAPSTIPALVASIYAGVSRAVWPAAARQILAYVQALESEGRVRSRSLDRLPDAEEARILHPDLRAIADPQLAAVARAELGYDAPAPLVEYALRDAC